MRFKRGHKSILKPRRSFERRDLGRYEARTEQMKTAEKGR